MRICPRCESEITDDRFVFCNDECFEAYFAPPLENMIQMARETSERAAALQQTADSMLRAIRDANAVMRRGIASDD